MVFCYQFIWDLGKRRFVYMKILITPRSFASFSDKPLKMLTEKGYEIKRNNISRPYKKRGNAKSCKRYRWDYHWNR